MPRFAVAVCLVALLLSGGCKSIHSPTAVRLEGGSAPLAESDFASCPAVKVYWIKPRMPAWMLIDLLNNNGLVLCAENRVEDVSSYPAAADFRAQARELKACFVLHEHLDTREKPMDSYQSSGATSGAAKAIDTVGSLLDVMLTATGENTITVHSVRTRYFRQLKSKDTPFAPVSMVSYEQGGALVDEADALHNDIEFLRQDLAQASGKDKAAMEKKLKDMEKRLAAVKSELKNKIVLEPGTTGEAP